MVFQPLTDQFMTLAFNLLIGSVILFDLFLIALIQLGYQIKIGNTILIGSTRARRVLMTFFGYEISIGGIQNEM